MKILNTLALIASLLCVLTSIAESDWTEAMAWFIISLYSIKDLSNNKPNDK